MIPIPKKRNWPKKKKINILLRLWIECGVKTATLKLLKNKYIQVKYNGHWITR